MPFILLASLTAPIDIDRFMALRREIDDPSDLDKERLGATRSTGESCHRISPRKESGVFS